MKGTRIVTSYYRVRLGIQGSGVDECVDGGFLGVYFGIRQDLTNDLPDDWREFNRRFIPQMIAEGTPYVGIIYAGTLVPAVNAAAGGDGWRTSWLVLGVTALVIAAIVGALLRNRPADKGLEPIGGGEAAAGSAALSPAHAAPASRRRILAHLGAIYFLFGYTYVIYATFIVTTLVQERGFSEVTAGGFWAWIGVLSLASGPVFGTLSDRIGRRAGLMVVFALQSTAYLLVALPLPDAFLYLSIGLFGICAWSIPGIMAAACGDYMGAEHAVAGFGTITFFFGIGQIIGPAVAGVAAEAADSFASSFAMAAAMAAAAIAISAFLRRPD